MNNKSISFMDLGLSRNIVETIEKKGFEYPTEVQVATIPKILNESKDIVSQAQTGTGKTAAFGLPILDLISKQENNVQVLVLTPTRELTLQVATELQSFVSNNDFTIVPIVGGQSMEVQLRQLKKKTDIVVGTPGRLKDHLKRKSLDISHVDFVVLDEADEMLNSGFIEDIEWILSKTNQNHRSFLFSATIPQQIVRLVQTFMPNHDTVKIKSKTLGSGSITQTYINVRHDSKFEALCRLIDFESDFYGLIFCRTKREVDKISDQLMAVGYDAEAMHGDFTQAHRERVLDRFKNKRCSILVVTDVASRGLDIQGLTHVINHSLPENSESYVHRVGRTGRAGKKGTAITLLGPSERRKMSQIERVAPIQKAELPSIEAVIESKKKSALERVSACIKDGVDARFHGMAQELLSTHDPEDAMAAVLHLAFQKELSTKKMSSYKIQKSFKGSESSDRSFRRQRPRSGHQGQGGPKRFSSRQRRSR